MARANGPTLHSKNRRTSDASPTSSVVVGDASIPTRMAGIPKQIATALAYFASGFTLRDLLSFCARQIRMRRERLIDDRIIAYLIQEIKSSSPVKPDAYGHLHPTHYRSSRQIADALKLDSVDVLQRLERMEEKRVKHVAPKVDQWTPTTNELHDAARRPRKRCLQVFLATLQS